MCVVLDKSLFWKSTLFDLTTEIWNNYLTWELKSAMKIFLISTYIDEVNFLFCRNQTTDWKKTSRKCKGLIASGDLKLNLSKTSISFRLIISVFHWINFSEANQEYPSRAMHFCINYPSQHSLSYSKRFLIDLLQAINGQIAIIMERIRLT